MLLRIASKCNPMSIVRPTTITIQDYRLSFIRVATVLPEQSGGSEFVRRADYEKLFATLQSNGVADGFSLPWENKKPFAHRFWLRYLNTLNAANVASSVGWAMGVPLRGNGPAIQATLPSFKGRVSIERYFHPFGLALVVTLTSNDPIEAGEWVDQATLAATASFAVKFRPEEPARNLNLAALANAWFTQMRDQYFGPNASLSAAPDPFTIMTVCRGTGVDESLPPDDTIHHLLFGAASLRKNWSSADLSGAPLAASRLKTQTGGSPGDVAFATRRGRAIWTPSSFVQAKPLTSQSCYHRNQVVGALQVESLCSLANTLRLRLDNSSILPNHINVLGQIPARVLVDLHKGEAHTYRSISLQRQIDDRGARDDIVKLRQRYVLPPWAPAAAPAA